MRELSVSVTGPGTTKVFVDGVQIGLVQELTFREADVEIRFPSEEVIGRLSDGLQEKHRMSLDLLREVPGVRVSHAAPSSRPANESLLVSFFLGAGKDSAGRTLRQVLEKDDSWFERTHDYVQWLLPTRSRSAYEPSAPVLTEDDVRAFQVRGDLSRAHELAVERMLRFLQVGAPRPFWVRRKDHNHKRISRLLKSLKDLGLTGRAEAVFMEVMGTVKDHPGVIDPENVRHWHEAVGLP